MNWEAPPERSTERCSVWYLKKFKMCLFIFVVDTQKRKSTQKIIFEKKVRFVSIYLSEIVSDSFKSSSSVGHWTIMCLIVVEFSLFVSFWMCYCIELSTKQHVRSADCLQLLCTSLARWHSIWWLVLPSKKLSKVLLFLMFYQIFDHLLDFFDLEYVHHRPLAPTSQPTPTTHWHIKHSESKAPSKSFDAFQIIEFLSDWNSKIKCPRCMMAGGRVEGGGRLYR